MRSGGGRQGRRCGPGSRHYLIQHEGYEGFDLEAVDGAAGELVGVGDDAVVFGGGEGRTSGLAGEGALADQLGARGALLLGVTIEQLNVVFGECDFYDGHGSVLWEAECAFGAGDEDDAVLVPAADGVVLAEEAVVIEAVEFGSLNGAVGEADFVENGEAHGIVKRF